MTWSKAKNVDDRGLRRALWEFKSDRGNLESALTLIPLMILFLSVAQVAISVYAKGILSQTTQGALAYAAMGATSRESDLIPGTLGAAPWSAPPIALPLPGGGSILVGQRQEKSPVVTPLLPGGLSFTSTGVAVQE